MSLAKKITRYENRILWFSRKTKKYSGSKMGKKEQLLFVQKFGDDADRALIKPNGN